MIRVLVVLCLLVGPAFGHLDAGYRVRFSFDKSTFGNTAFIGMPLNTKEASERGWKEVKRPDGPSGYKSLVMWCPEDDYTLCILYDDTGYIAGSQIAFNLDIFEDAIFDWSRSGFTKWSLEIDGTTTKYWAIQQYFLSTDDLATDKANRLTIRDSSKIVQGDYIYVTGFNGTLFSIPMDKNELKTNTNFTEQSCMSGMGTHYYYNMTSSLNCSENTVLTWFALEYDGRCVGTGFLWFGKYPINNDKINIFEYPTRYFMKLNAPNAPECMYSYTENPGVLTSHSYFLNDPFEIICP